MLIIKVDSIVCLCDIIFLFISWLKAMVGNMLDKIYRLYSVVHHKYFSDQTEARMMTEVEVEVARR